MRKVLRLGAYPRKDGDWDLVVEEQSHRWTEFGNSGYGKYQFVDSNGFKLMSDSMPEFIGGGLFVRGVKESKDNLSVVVSDAVLKKIEVAVKEYNEYEF